MKGLVTPRNSGHIPVMVDEVVRNLALVPDGAYLDLTAGLGGHLEALANQLEPAAKLYGVDRDKIAIELAFEKLGKARQKIRIEHASYVEIESVVDQFEDNKFDGILLDLGLSSLQLDDPSRGFAFSGDGALDMRFDQTSRQRTAADLVNSLPEKELAGVFFKYGEERASAKIAKAIVRERQKEMIRTTSDLKQIVSTIIPPFYLTKTLARLFQALRITVNSELEALANLLPKLPGFLKQGGRIVVLTYHSLEDRMIKHFFKKEATDCICPPRLPGCICGHTATVKIITKRAILPTSEEVSLNPRARSAKLRIAQRV